MLRIWVKLSFYVQGNTFKTSSYVFFSAKVKFFVFYAYFAVAVFFYFFFFFVSRIENTTCNHRSWHRKTSLHNSTDHLKRKSNVVSAYQSRFEAPSLGKFVSFTNTLFESAALLLYSYSTRLLSVAYVIFDLTALRFALYPYLHSFVLFSPANFVFHFVCSLSSLVELPLPLNNIRLLYTFAITYFDVVNFSQTILPICK